MQNAQELLNHFFGGAQSSPTPSEPNAARGRFNASTLINGPAGLATGALAGGLGGLLLSGKKPEKIAKSALTLGGMALVGGLAYKAWSNWKTNVPSAAIADTAISAPPPGSPFLPHDPSEQERVSLVLIRAMISAAKSDGHITDAERQRVSQQLAAVALDDEHRKFIEAELSAPLDIDFIVSAVNGPEQAAEVYAASLLAIDPSGAVEQAYLGLLAARLGLEPGLVVHLHAVSGDPKTKMAA